MQEQEEDALQVGAGSHRVHTLGQCLVIAELARGGMGIVYLALMRGPAAFSKLVVLKELKPELLEDPAVVAMFMDEARLAACLSHPNIVQTLEAGCDGNRRYIAMEYLDGQSLSRLLIRARKSGVTLPLEFVGAVLCHALEGLAYAHNARDYSGDPLGIVHRDISPQNIFIGYDGQVKILDFGIAKAKTSLAATRAGVLKGKVAYMAPEQASGAPVDARADLFAVGVMLWEAVVGRRFWSGTGTDVQIIRALLRGDLDAGRDARMASIAEASEDLRAVITKAVATDPSQRYASAAEFLIDLLAALSACCPPLPKAADIGRVVHDLFSADRAKLQVAIEEAIRFQRGPISGKYTVAELRSLLVEAERSSTNPGLDEQPELPALWQAMSSETSLAPRPFSPTSAPPVVTAPEAEDAFSLRPMGAVVLGIGATILCGALAVAASSWMSRRPLAVTPATMVAPAAPAHASAVAPSETAPIENVRLTIRASPAQARIRIDHELSFANPCVIVMPKDGSSHGIHVEAEGFVAWDDSFESNRDTSLIIALDSRRGADKMPARAAVRAATAPPAASGASAGNLFAVPVDSSPRPPLRRINSINPYNPYNPYN